MIDGRRMQLLREWPQVLLLPAGLASFALGDWLVAVQAGALVDEAQGICDFISCVNSTTVPAHHWSRTGPDRDCHRPDFDSR
jgi:hypothetical protein